MRMFAPRGVYCLPVFLFFCFHCPFANQIGYRPQGGIKGREIQDQVKFEVLAAYSLSLYTFCSDLFEFDACLKGTASESQQGGLAASLLAADGLPVVADEYYTAGSAASCAQRTALAAGALTLVHLNSKKKCSSLIRTNCTFPASEVVQAGILAGLAAPGFCNAEKVGSILSFHQYNLP